MSKRSVVMLPRDHEVPARYPPLRRCRKASRLADCPRHWQSDPHNIQCVISSWLQSPSSAEPHDYVCGASRIDLHFIGDLACRRFHCMGCGQGLHRLQGAPTDCRLYQRLGTRKLHIAKGRSPSTTSERQGLRVGCAAYCRRSRCQVPLFTRGREPSTTAQSCLTRRGLGEARWSSSGDESHTRWTALRRGPTFTAGSGRAIVGHGR